MSDDTVRLLERLLTIENRLNSIEAAVKKPFFKDSRFWAGVVTIPVLVASGWLGDILAFDKKPALIGFMHRAVGTQPVIQDALKHEDDPLRKELVSQLEKAFTKKDELTTAVSAELNRRADILHAEMLQIGLVRADRIRKVGCQTLIADTPAGKGNKLDPGSASPDSICEDVRDAVVRAASAVFGLRRYEKVNIDIGVHVAELPRNETGALALEPRSPKSAPNIADLIQVEIDERKIDLKPQDQWVRQQFGEQKLVLYHLREENIELSKAAARSYFPMHTLSVFTREGAPDNYIFLVAILVTTSVGKP